METLSQQDIEQAIGKASRDVFDTMLNLPVEIEPSVTRPKIEPEVFDGVVALLGIAGSWTGTGHISCTAVFAQKMAGALLLTEYESINEEVLDAVAEVANMIVGNVKTIFEEKLGPLGLTVPTVIFGRNYKTRSAGVKNWVMVRLRSEGESMDINFCMMPAKILQQMAHRSEAMAL